MKAHMASLPLPPKPSSPSSSSEDQEQEKEEEKDFVYGLRENPKKSFRFSDPEFSFVFDSGSVVQDRESETESRNPTRRRSKRNWKSVDLPTEPVSPSVLEASPEEDVAMSLMMLSSDIWIKQQGGKCSKQRSGHVKNEVIRTRNSGNGGTKKIYECPFCSKIFGSGQALGGHKRSHLLTSSATTSLNYAKFEGSLIDLNLPAQVEEEEEFSAVSEI